MKKLIGDNYHYEIKNGEGWDFYDRKIKPDQYFLLQEENQQIITSLEKAGSNLEKDHELEFVLYGNKEGFEKTQKDLSDKKSVEISISDDSMQVTITAPLDLDRITNISHNLKKIAIENGVEYDGWGAMVVK